MSTYMSLNVAALVDKTAVPGLRRVFIPPFHHPQFSPWTERRQPPVRPCAWLTTRRLSAAWRFVLGVRPNVKRVFQPHGSRACFSIAARIWHCYSTPPAHGVYHTP